MRANVKAPVSWGEGTDGGEVAEGGVGDVEAAPSYQLVDGWVAGRHRELGQFEKLGDGPDAGGV